MAKIIFVIKEFCLNTILVLLVLIMIALMYFNWTKGLDVDSMPENFFIYDFVMNFVQKDSVLEYEIQSQKIVTPSKVSIKNDDKHFSIMYDEVNSLSIYNEVFSDIESIDSEQITIVSSNVDEFMQSLEADEYVYMEFLCPLTAIINIESDIFVTDMIIEKNNEDVELFIKSNNDFYKITIKQTKMTFTINENFSTHYKFVCNDEGIINLISSASFSTFDINVSSPFINLQTEQNLISTFLYNPIVVTSYEISYNEEIYVNEYSTISIINDYIEFESNDPRGYIFSDQLDISGTRMIELSIDIFNEIYGHIESEIIPYPSDFYYKDGQTVIVLSGKYNGLDINLQEPFGIFAFSSSGLSYCKINMLLVEQLSSRVSLVATNLLNDDNKLIVSYDMQGYANWRYYID